MNFAQIMMVLISTISAVWSGKTIVDVAAKQGAWGNMDGDTYIGAVFLQYHKGSAANGPTVQVLMTALAAGWILAALFDLLSVVSWPFYIAYEMNLEWAGSA